MEFLSEHLGLDRSFRKTLKEDVDECVLIDWVFYDTACKVTHLLCMSVHITLTLLEPKECRA